MNIIEAEFWGERWNRFLRKLKLNESFLLMQNKVYIDFFSGLQCKSFTTFNYILSSRGEKINN